MADAIGAKKIDRKKGARKLKSTGMRNGTNHEKKCALYSRREDSGDTRKMRRLAKLLSRTHVRASSNQRHKYDGLRKAKHPAPGYQLGEKGKVFKTREFIPVK